MPYKYLYIDDTKANIEQGAINALQDGGEIIVDFDAPSNWENLIQELTDVLPNYNGIILDLRLNDNPYEDGKFAQYKGSTVAQELRSLSKESRLKDLPIILFSGTNKIEHYLDPTSVDLFDLIVDKNKVEQPNYITYAEFRRKLKGLSDGYEYLHQSEKIPNSVLDFSHLLLIDIRFVEHFQNLMKKPVHSIAHFLVKQVMNSPSFLINEDYLSARLGVDRNSPDWESFLDTYMKGYRYNGAFATLYQRWWMPLIEDFWTKSISTEHSLRNTSASKKVELINEKTEFKNLHPLAKQDKSKSDSFWVVCKATRVAIDTIDGFVIAGQDAKYPWQEPEYISINEALRPTANFEISTTEKPRLQKLKQLFEKNEQRLRK